MSSETLNLEPHVLDYLRAVSLREPALLTRLRKETANLPESNMQISPEQGQFMNLLVKLIGAQRIIEIGTFTGYSALCMAQALPAHGELICCDISEKWTAVARRYFDESGLSDKIRLELAPALQTLNGLLSQGKAEPFDFAFIDADKTSYFDYYERCLELLRPGGVVAVDNTLWSGSVADETNQEADTIAIRNFNAHLKSDARIDLSLVPIGDGLTLARKR